MASHSSATEFVGAHATLVRALIGAVLFIVGAGALVGLVIVTNSTGGHPQMLMFELGLAGTVLASATAQIVMIVGAALLWTVVRRPARPTRADLRRSDIPGR